MAIAALTPAGLRPGSRAVTGDPGAGAIGPKHIRRRIRLRR